MPKTFTQSLFFDAPPSALFELYTDARLHAEATGAGAAIEPAAGRAFTAWDGYIGGVNLHVVKDRMVVQTWRSADWSDKDEDSILVLLFEPERSGTRLLLTHANVPDEEAVELRKGWTEYYWKPWKAWLKSK
jgi:activator of HSP90 ATPase